MSGCAYKFETRNAKRETRNGWRKDANMDSPCPTPHTPYPIPHQKQGALDVSRFAFRVSRFDGFTLTEMIVAVALLVELIMAVGQIFKNTGKAISLAQASSDVTSNVRSAQMQMDQDLAGLDRNGFLSITQIDTTNSSDQIVFTTTGNFTGYTSTANFSTSTSANEAIVQYDQATTGGAGVNGILARQYKFLSTYSGVAGTGLPGTNSPGTPGQIYASLATYETPAAIVKPDPNPWIAATPVAGYYAMMPTMMQGVSTFRVAWTDGTSTAGVLNWTAATSTPKIFSQGGTYPKAIRFTYTVTDSKNFLQGGRTYVHVVKVPD